MASMAEAEKCRSLMFVDGFLTVFECVLICLLFFDCFFMFFCLFWKVFFNVIGLHNCPKQLVQISTDHPSLPADF